MESGGGSGPQKFVSTEDPTQSFKNQADRDALDESIKTSKAIAALYKAGDREGLFKQFGITSNSIGPVTEWAALTQQQVNLVNESFGQAYAGLRRMADGSIQGPSDVVNRYLDDQARIKAEQDAASAAMQKANDDFVSHITSMVRSLADALYGAGRSADAANRAARLASTTISDSERRALQLEQATQDYYNMVQQQITSNPLNDPQFAELFPQPNYGFGIGGTNRIGGSQNWTGGTQPGFDSSPALMMQPNGGGVNLTITGNYIMDQNTVNSLTNRVATQLTTILRTNAGLKL